MKISSPWILALGLAALCGCSRAGTTPIVNHPTAIVAEDPPSTASAEEIIDLQAAAANKLLLADRPGEVTLRIRLGAKPKREVKRPAVNLGLVIDTSGSMEGDAIKDARTASLALIDALAEGDRLAVVTFDSEARVLVPSTRLDKGSIAKVKAQIGAMKARGTTDMAAGLRKALDEVERNFQAQGVNRVVMLGDGVPNDERAVMPLVAESAQRTIPVTVLGLGLDYNETLMTAIAQQSGGKYHFVKESSAVASVFKDEVLRLKQVVGRNAALRLMPGPGVTIKEVVGLPSSAAGADTQVTLGDLSEGEDRDVIVRLTTTGRRAGSVIELCDAELSFQEPGAVGRRLSERSFVAVHASADPKEIAAGRDLDVERSAARVSVADRIVRAIALARAGNLAEAQAMLDAAERDARMAAQRLDDADLLEKAKSIGPLRASLPERRQPVVAVRPSPVPGGPRPVADKPAAAPEAAPVSIVMASQAAAVGTIQGD